MAYSGSGRILRLVVLGVRAQRPRSADGQLVPPSAFVALKSAADAAAHRQPQAITRAAPAGQNPVWSQLLQLRYPEQALPHERLQVSVLHEGSGLLLLKGSVPLSCLIPGQHYSLAVALSDACCLYLTLVLGLASTALALPGSWPEQQQSPHATASPAPLRTQQQQQQQQCSSLRCASQDVLETLVGDALAKQQTLERLQRSLDVAESRREMAACRLADVQAQNSKLSADLQHLRQLTLERTRNAELVHRLQQLHAEQVDVIELQKQYAELQEAHYQQSQLLCDQEASTAAIAALRKVLSDQEAVISRLEALLAAAAGRAKEGEGWRSTADALQAEVMRLREELARLQAVHPADEIAEAAARAAAAAAEQQAAAAALAERDHAALANAAEFEARLSSKESERLAAAMRAERAEAAATAAQNELLDVTKRYAREIAQLKTKLAEKDAQLLGGFGSLANLCLSELGPGSSLQLNPAGFQNHAAAGLGFGQYAAGAPLETLWGFNNLGYNQGLQLQQGLGGGLSNGFDATAGGAAAAAAAGRAAFGVPQAAESADAA
ncbi:hypothetical protein OEZ85_014332 [Tetradesmus obliquus]|uniref:C2 domain-containing protein n=1 Tax=Tetradesmus obliquus TaxID=3088 RepID=A0ABY8U8T0_TETOB|nr:hypothetical protein OEZ85_014332 [Tetradesmus obliquus]